MESLKVWMDARTVGDLEGPDPFVFGYRQGVDASLAVSLTMPVRLQSWTDRALHPIFQMNLPEGAMLIAIRQAIAKIARTDDLSLLRILGGYQIGRNRFTPPDEELPSPSPPESLEDILKYPDTEELFYDLMKRYLLRSGVSGVQPKVLLDARDRATFRSCAYVVKSWGADHPQLAANEYFCMTAAIRSGLPAPEFHLSDDGRLFIMKRFDIDPAGKDLGFEDMCVLQGIGADRKYDGTCERVARAIERYVSAGHRAAAKEIFFQSLVLSVAVRNGDAHLKNYGVVYGDPLGNNIRLAPIYDVVTTAAYIPRDIPALSLGGSKKWWSVGALRKFGISHCGLSQGRIREILDAVTGAVGDARAQIRRYAEDHPDFRETAAGMLAAWEAGLTGLEEK
ncbi:MAG: type II toxin-antitoxin system HipA family toxin [Proteobacteria bacterium]|nr:type II toxin-antitoxin system HipA family toxin [Pseudomonadota bacterium]MBU2226443.1 type II toxin-antitoxin system HipA family toxin [Pseudomonadota bacterium]MBU2260446.1 type II toxin-antitoxin system HipA family toxin [Pseudomonadota bacterium]